MGFGTFLRAVGAQLTPGGGTYRSTYDDEEQRRRERQQEANARKAPARPALQVNRTPNQNNRGLRVQSQQRQPLQVQQPQQPKINITNLLDDMRQLYVGDQLIKRDPASRTGVQPPQSPGFNLASFGNELARDTVAFIPQLSANYSQAFGNLGTKLAGGKPQNTRDFWRGTPGAEQTVKWSGANGTLGQTLGGVGQLGLTIATAGTGTIAQGAAKPLLRKSAQVGYDAAVGGAFNVASAQSQGQLTKDNALQTFGIGASFGAGGNLVFTGASKAYNKATGKDNLFGWLANETNVKKIEKTLRKQGLNFGKDAQNVAKSIANALDENEVVRILTDPSNIGAGTLAAGITKEALRPSRPGERPTPENQLPEIELPYEPPGPRSPTTPAQEALIEQRINQGLDPVTGEPVNRQTLGLDKPLEEVWKAPTPQNQAPLQVRPGGPAAPTSANQVPNPIAPTNQGSLRNQVGRALTDEDTVIIRELKNIEKQSGLPGIVDQFYYDSGLQRRANSIANNKFQNSPQVKDALGGLGKKGYGDFNEYAAARRELANANKGLPTSKSPEELMNIVNNADSELAGRYNSLRDYYFGLANDLKNAGIIDEKRFREFTSDDDYIRVQRNMDDLFNRPGGAGNAYSLGQTLTRFRRTGSQRDVLPAGETALDYTQRIQKEIQRNQTATHLIDTLASAGQAKQVKEGVRKNVIRRRVNGKEEIWEVSPEIREAVEHINPYTLNGLMQIIAAPGRTLRAGTTALNPVFTASNYGRDQLTSAILSKDAKRTSIHFAEGLGNAIAAAGDMNNSALWQKFIAHAGDVTSYDLTRNIQKGGRVIRGIRLGKRGKAGNAVLQPIRTLEDLNSITEKATRFQNFKGIYNKVLKDTGDESRALQEATIAAWQTTIDFNRAGTWGRVMNLIFPYSNPGIQGTRQTIKTFKERPMATSLKGTALVGMPLATAALWNMADPERKAVYDNISDHEKENNVVIVLPGTKQNQDGSYNVIKIAMPPGLGSLWQPFRRATESFVGESPDMAEGMLQDVLKAFSGPIQTGSKDQLMGSLIPQAVKPAVQAAANKDFFTGKQTIPDYMKEADTTDQAFPFTSGAATGVAKAIGASPIGVEKFIGDTFGSLGKYGLNTVDTQLAKTGVTTPDQVGGESIGKGFQRRFALASGKYNHNKSEGAKFYESVDKSIKDVGLNKNEREAFHGTIMPAKKDFLGNTLNDKTYYDAANKATTWQRYPKTFEVSKAIDAESRKRGNPGDPLFDLTPEQQKLVLTMMSNNSPGNYEEKAITKLNPWLKDFYKNRGEFFDAVGAKSKEKIADLEAKGKLSSTEQKQLKGLKESVAKSGIDPMGMKIPKADEALQAKLDEYSKMDGKTKHQYTVDNPEIADYFTAQNDYKRAKRAFLGLPQFDNYPKPSADVQKIMDAYNKLPKGNGPKKRDGTNSSPDRSAWIKAHPKEWAAMQDAFDKIAAWNAADEGALAVYEGLNAEGNPDGTPLKDGGAGTGNQFLPFQFYGRKPGTKDDIGPNISNFVGQNSERPFSPIPKMQYKKLPNRALPKGTARKLNITSLTLPSKAPTFNPSNSRKSK